MIAQVTVSIEEDGRVNIKAGGPDAGNKVVLLGLLEIGKALLNQQEAKPPGAPLLLARGALPNGM